MRTTPIEFIRLRIESRQGHLARVVDLGELGDEGVGCLLHGWRRSVVSRPPDHLLPERRVERLVLRAHRPHANALPILQGEPALQLAGVGTNDEARIGAALGCNADRLHGLSIQVGSASYKGPPALASSKREPQLANGGAVSRKLRKLNQQKRKGAAPVS